MKNLLLPTLVLLATLPVLAADAPADKSAAPADAPAAPAAPPSSPEAQKAWDKLADDFKALPKIGEEGPSPDAKKAIASLYAEAHDFYTKFPDDSHMINATMLWAQLGSAMIRFKLDGAPTLKDIDTTLNLLTTNPKLPKEKRAEIRVVMIAKSMREAMQSDDMTAWDAIDAKIDAFEKDYGDKFVLGNQPVMPMLRQQELQVLSQMPDKTRYDALLKKLSTSDSEQIAGMAKEMMDQEKKVADLKNKPIDLKFKSVDGKEVDLSKLRGKVVLVDFWATWCPPCREEVPNVVAAYKKYGSKGFEVVGISLDQDKDKLLKFTKENGMTWPQYFDGKGWQNDISSTYGIDAIPAMWLVDKKGMIVSTEAGQDLDGLIGKQLAAP